VAANKLVVSRVAVNKTAHKAQPPKVLANRVALRALRHRALLHRAAHKAQPPKALAKLVAHRALLHRAAHKVQPPKALAKLVVHHKVRRARDNPLNKLMG
jgi:hypothetical protein